MLVMPLFHVHGLLCALLATLYSGGSMIVPAKFSVSDFWKDFITHKANWYTAVPTIHQILLKSPPPNPAPYIRFIRSCSSPLSPTVFHQLEEAFNAPVLEAYAMTEAAHQMTSNPLPPGKRKPGSVGIGQGVEVAILDEDGNDVPQGKEGEICIRGENVTKGYLNNPSANASAFTKGGFFRTGDQGTKDEDGYVIITGRIKELINKGGEKISPIELDNVLTTHAAVSEAVSFAIPDELYGQDIGVAVVLKPGAKLGQDDLRGWIAGKLAKFKVPKKVGHIYGCVFFVWTMLIIADLFYGSHAENGNGQDPASDRGGDDAEAGHEGEVVKLVRHGLPSASPMLSMRCGISRFRVFRLWDRRGFEVRC